MPDSLSLFILVLLSIICGWLLGRWQISRKRRQQPPDFIPSVDFLLNHANDRALQRILNVDAMDSDHLDLLIKLGKILREKGEVERAIQLHQSLFARVELDHSARAAVQLELACNFLHAGVLDRAENLLVDLLDNKSANGEKVSTLLLELLEDEQDWARILLLQESKRLHASAKLNERTAQAACELAERHLKDKNFLEVRRYCQKALKIHSHCARAYVIQGISALMLDEPHEAFRCLSRAVKSNPRTAVHVLAPMLEVAQYSPAANEKVRRFLQESWQVNRYVPALAEHVRMLSNDGDTQQAAELMLAALDERPSNRAFLVLMELLVEQKQVLDQSQLLSVYDILRRIVESEPLYTCRSCGYSSVEAHWRCPRCKEWETLTPFAPKNARTQT